MKKLALVVFLFLAIINGANAQYIVTKVSGRVKNAAGDLIRPGTQLKSNEQLTWSSLKDKLWVVIIGKGEKVISPTPDATPVNNLFTQVLISSLHQNSSAGSLSGRGEIIEKIPDALKTDASSNGKVVIEDDGKYLFDPKLFPQTGGNTFFIQIDAPQQAPITRPLKTLNDTVFITSSDLVTETTGPEIKYTLGYYNLTAADKSQLVTTFTPYFDRTSEVESTIANTIIAYQSTGAKLEIVRDSVYRNVYANIGKPNGLLFTTVFNKYWQSKGAPEKKNGLPSGTGLVFDENEFKNVPELSGSVGLTRDEIPDNYSLRQFAPPVGYQGEYSSCTAWSTSYAARTISFAVQHKYSINNQYNKIISYTFAPDFIYNNINTTGNCYSGTSLFKALDFIKNYGDIRKKGDLFLCGKKYTATDLNAAKPYRIKDYSRINDASIAKADLILKIKSLILSKHPLPFGMILPESFQNVDQSGIWYPKEAERAAALQAKQYHKSYLGHAMCIVGYDDNINNGSFEIMNSWGTWIGNKGFFWINYDDFFDFVADVYSILDYSTDVTAPETPTQADITVVSPKSLTVVTDKPITNNIIEADPAKPRLKGNIEFMLMKPTGDFENIPVNKTTVDTRGQVVENDNGQKVAYANFVLARPLYSGNRYKIKFGLSESAYVYIIGMGKNSSYILFPQVNINESPLINFNNATLILPNKTQNYHLDNVTGKEHMCVLVSKSPIDINSLNQKFSDHNFYQDVKDFLNSRMVEMKSNSYLDNRIDFNTLAKEDDVVAFFIELDHL